MTIISGQEWRPRGREVCGHRGEGVGRMLRRPALTSTLSQGKASCRERPCGAGSLAWCWKLTQGGGTGGMGGRSKGG